MPQGITTLEDLTDELKLLLGIDPNQITTSDDGTESIYSNDEVEHVLNGSGDNYKVIFKDSESEKLWTVGQSKTVFNNSSEVAIVTDDNASFFEFLVPRATATVKCTAGGIGTTTFDYLDNAQSLPPSVRYIKHDDWSDSRGGINYNTDTDVSGGGQAFVRTSVFSNTPGGTGSLNTGASGALDHGLFSKPRDFINIGQGAILLRSRQRVSGGNATDERVIYSFGISDTHSGATPGSAPANAIRLRYDTVGTDWQGSLFSSSSETVVNTVSTPFVAAVQGLDIVIKSDGTRVDFWVDNTHVGNSTTGIPSGGLNYQIVVEGLGTTAVGRTVNEDFHYLYQNLTTKRG